jgi:RES domain-containing protein
MGAHDGDLLDALSEFEPTAFAGDAWRVTRKGFDPLRGSTARGRWSAGPDIEVLYTSRERDGALAEIGFRLSLEPVWPSRMEHEIHTLGVATTRTLKLVDFAALEKLGVDTARYQGFDYSQTSAVSAAAHFLDFDGLIVPSARSDCQHLVLFKDRIKNLKLTLSVQVDWAQWRKQLTKGHSSLI